jgi:hypothetical protein
MRRLFSTNQSPTASVFSVSPTPGVQSPTPSERPCPASPTASTQFPIHAGWQVFVSRCAYYRVEYPPSWFLHPTNGPENDVGISSENVPAPMLMTLSRVWLSVTYTTWDRAKCSTWYLGQRDATIPYSVGGVAGEVYTTVPVSPPAAADVVWGRGADFWSNGVSLNLFFIHATLASRDANRSLEYRIIDTLRFL